MPHSSPFPDIPIPETDLWSMIFERKIRPFTDSKEIFTDAETGRTLTFGELRSAALEFGKGLKALWSWQKGDVLALYTPNSIDTPVVTCGLLWAGGVACPANPLYTAGELTHQLRSSGAKALATQLPLLATARAAAEAAGIPSDRIILLGDERDGETAAAATAGRAMHYSAVRSTAYCSRYAPARIRPREDLAFLVYSSGTTGLPKGVCLSHYNVVANILQFSQMDGLYFHPYGGPGGKGDKGLGVTPFFHIYGLTCNMFASMYLGWELIVMARFDMEKACALVEKHRITFAYVPPPIVLAFSKHPVVDKYDVTSLRSLHSGAAPLTKELTEELWNRLKLPVKQGYGLSETSPVSHMQLPEEWGKFMGSVGKLLPNIEAKICDLEGNEVPDGKDGELWLKGPNIFLGYLNEPEKTKDAMSSCGYFKTGDIFQRDKHGNYYCVDRLKELIKYKGFQVPPAELEGLLLGHPHVLDAGVIGIEDKAQATEVPRAYVVLQQGQPRSDEKAREIVEWTAKQTAPHKKLRGGVHFIDEVPKSASGKILRRVLKDQAKEEERKSGAKL